MHCHVAHKIFYPQGLQTEICKAAKASVCTSIYEVNKAEKIGNSSTRASVCRLWLPYLILLMGPKDDVNKAVRLKI